MSEINLKIEENQPIAIEIADEPEVQVEMVAQGPRGETGGTGPTGPQGPQGNTGLAATIEVGTVTTVDPEVPADVENIGTPQEAVLDFSIPKGETGEKGDQGDAATINIGTVTTGNPEDPANVTNVGTENDAILDFTIPQGEKGDKGDPGTGEIPGGVDGNLVGINASGFIEDSGLAPSAFATALGADDNYVTDAEKTKLANLSGTNTGDQDLSSYATKTGSETLTGKRITPRVTSTASASSLTPTKADADRYIYTALAANLTINNPTMDVGESLVIQITDNSTEREIDWGNQYVGIDGQPLAEGTVDDKTMEFILTKVAAAKILVSYVVEA